MSDQNRSARNWSCLVGFFGCLATFVNLVTKEPAQRLSIHPLLVTGTLVCGVGLLSLWIAGLGKDKADK